MNGRFRKLIIVVLIFLIVCLSCIGIWSYLDYNKKEDDKKVDFTHEYEILDVNDNFVQELFFLTRGENTFQLFYDTKYYNIYYLNEVTDISKVEEDFKKLIAYYSLDRSVFTIKDEEMTFNASDLKQQYIKIFGADDSYEDSIIYCNCPSSITYNKNSNTYSIPSGFGTEILEGYYNRITDARKYDDKIEIYEKAVFYKVDLENEVNIYFENANFDKQIVSMPMNETFEIKDYEKQLNTYKYTFIKNGAEYNFNKVEMIK